MTIARRALSPSLPALLVALSFGCSRGAPVRGAPGISAHKPAGEPAKEPTPPEPPAFPEASLLATVPEGTFGPYVGRRGDRSLAFYAPPTAGGRRWTSLAIGAAGKPLGAPRDLGPAPETPPRVVVRPVHDGFAAAWTRAVDRSSAAEILVMSPDGEPRGGVQLVAQTADELMYVDALEIGAGTVALFASHKGDHAELSAVPLAPDGRPRGVAVPLGISALAWQVVPTGADAALGFVVAAEKGKPGGQIALARIDGEGKLLGKPSLVSETPTADPDIDMVRAGDRLLLAWTDRRELDPRVYVAATDLAGKVESAPHAASTPHGEQAFVGLVAPDPALATPRALLAWDDVAERTGGPDLPVGARAIRLGVLDPAGTLGPTTATFAFAGASHEAPDLAASADGFAATTLAPMCLRGTDCEGAKLAPTALRFSADLGVLGSEPVRAAAFDGEAALMAWGLSCSKDRCFSLATVSRSPAPILSIELPARVSAWAPSAHRDSPPRGPHALALDAVFAGEHLADAVAADVDGRTLVAWVTYFAGNHDEPAGRPKPDAKKADGKSPDAKKPDDPKRPADAKKPADAKPAAPAKPPVAAAAAVKADPGDPKKPKAATVAVRALDAKGEPSSAPTTISIRGESVGGVALAPGAAGKGEACLAWVARDEGDLQVFLTRVGADGKRQAQEMLTHAKGDASDVAIAWAKDGWVVAWVDARDGNGEVYAAKVDRNLHPVVREKRITNAKGDASDVRVLVRDGDVWLAWAEARARDSAADVLTTRLSAADLGKRGDDVKVAGTTLHSRAPELAVLGSDVVVGWIEEAPSDPAKREGSAFGVELVRLDASGVPRGAPAVVPLGMPATSLALSCTTVCRGITSGATPTGLGLFGFTWDGGAPGAPSRLVSLTSGPSGDVAPSFAGEVLFFADDDASGRGKVRRLRLAWE